MMIPDPLKKTIKVPIKIVDGQVQYFYGGELPKIANISGDLVIPAFALLDPVQAEELSQQDGSEMLPAGSELMINVNVDTYAEGVLTEARNPWPLLPVAPKVGFVKVRLEEPLYLWHRGTKTSQLSPCRCSFPDLKQEATSLNHAYTIASKKFETKRTSNTGNVFRHVYYKGNNGWEQLEWLRERLDAKFEYEHYKPSLPPPVSTEDQISVFTPAIIEPAPIPIFESETDEEQSFEEEMPEDVTAEEFDRLMAAGWYHYNKRFRRFNRRGSYTAIPLRIRLKDFKPSKSQRRVLRINADLKVDLLPFQVESDGDEWELFRRHCIRFGSKAPKEVHIPNPSELNKRFRVLDGKQLIAASYLEIGHLSSYAYYATFDPEVEWRSLGIFTMLKEIEYAKEQGKEFYYPGFAYDKPSLFDYKKRFHGLESYDWQTGEWKKFERSI